MGMTGALKLRQVVSNAEYVLAMELICAAQGLEYRLPLRPARQVESAAAMVREIVAQLAEDRVVSGEITRLAQEIRQGRFDRWRGQSHA
jgi:histidine ammonia-lyase